MPLLWENLANQLNSVRASTPYTYSFNTGTTLSRTWRRAPKGSKQH